MKKILSLLFISVGIFASSCTKTQAVVPNTTIITTVTANSWSTTDGGKTFSTSISMPEIDTYFNNHGAVLVYFTLDNGNSYEQVPEVFDGIAYSYSHQPGSLNVDIQASDGTTVISPPGTITFKIVLVESI